MIKSLLIKNYALIQHLKMDPSAHFNTLTGETGAGKSIILGALGLLLGNRADSKVLFDEDKKCVIEGTFDISKLNLSEHFESQELDYQDETIIRREISSTGKSRAFINDTPVTLGVMKSVSNFLVDIHSQRDTYLLGKASYQLRMFDGYAQNGDLLDEYKLRYKAFKKHESEFNILQKQAEELNKESDYNHFLFEELDKVGLKEGEQEALEEELQIIEHAEEIKSKLFDCQEIMENSEFSTNSGLQQVLKNIGQISAIAEHFEPLKSRLESCVHELSDIAKEIDNESNKVEFDQSRQEEVQERLGMLFQLYQKHHVNTESELIEICEELRVKVNKVLNLDDELSVAKEQLDQLNGELKDIGNKLTATRASVLKTFEKELESLLNDMAMPFANIDIQHEVIAPTENGMDKITLLFSANAGISPDELKNVASGGEFSRLMFSIKYMLAGKTSLPTIIFDEIDTGVSGEIAMNMVSMMKEMASRHQVLVITHLPQIAASGDEHYFVYKENENGRSNSKIKKLQQHEREEEIAKMIGGDNPSTIAMENARELLNR
jgi:DNA repair protein RecN (Recombination protein N)